MKVIVSGSINIDKLAEKLLEVAENTVAKVQAEQGAKINGYSIHEAEVTFKFDVEGIEEPQVMTVEHHEGSHEVFTWLVDAEEDTASNNEDDSLYDAWSVAQAKGTDFAFNEVDSVYSIIDLEEIPELSESFGDMSKKVYEHKEGFRVVQVRQNRKLIQEYKLIPKK